MEMQWKGIDLSGYEFMKVMPEIVDAECRARNTDPETSHRAARRASKAKSTFIQRAMILFGVRAWPRRTAQELHRRWRTNCPEVVMRFGGEQTGSFVHRNLKVLVEWGLIEVCGTKRCAVLGSLCQMYRAKPRQGELNFGGGE